MHLYISSGVISTGITLSSYMHIYSGVTDVTLVFGGTAPVAGAFLDAASEKIFEDKNKGMIA